MIGHRHEAFRLLIAACLAVLTIAAGSFSGDAARTLHLPLAAQAHAASRLEYHGGEVIAKTVSYAIFWSPPGTHFEDTPAGDAHYQSLVVRYLQDVGASPLYGVLGQYSYNPNTGQVVPGGPIENASAYGGSVVDTSPLPVSGDVAHPLTAADISKEALQVAAGQKWSADPPSTFFVYTPPNVNFCLNASGALCSASGYCAYHAWNWAPENSKLLVAVIGDAQTAHCQVPSSPNDDIEADSAVSWTSHEQAELVTDPYGCGWASDCNGSDEVGDLCQFQYSTLNPDGSDITLNGHPYILQEEWSNADAGCVLSTADRPPPPTATPAPSLTPIPLTLTVKVAHRVISPGKEQSLTVMTRPYAGVDMGVTFPDRSHLRHVWATGPTGRVSWAFKQPAGRTRPPDRTARVTVSVSLNRQSARRTTTYTIR